MGVNENCISYNCILSKDTVRIVRLNLMGVRSTLFQRTESRRLPYIMSTVMVNIHLRWTACSVEYPVNLGTQIQHAMIINGKRKTTGSC